MSRKYLISPSPFSKSRKGELTTQQIVTIVIILASFVILLYFLFRINPGETSSKQICYNSIVLSSKGAGLIGSLDCKTNYMCLSGGDSCNDFNPTVTAKVDVAKKEEVLKALADEIADCWWMFGEGKIDYVSSVAGDSHCAVCSRVKFDKKIQDTIKEITYAELADYMKTHQSNHDTSQSYLKYLYGANSLESSNTELKDFNINSIPIKTSNNYVIVTGIDPELIDQDKYIKANLVRTDEVTSKTRCEIFDITQA